LSRAKQSGAELALGGGALAISAMLLCAAAVLALATIMAAWAAALLVGGALGALGLLLVFRGKAKLDQVTFKPEQAMQSVEKDITAIKQAAK